MTSLNPKAFKYKYKKYFLYFSAIFLYKIGDIWYTICTNWRCVMREEFFFDVEDGSGTGVLLSPRRFIDCIEVILVSRGQVTVSGALTHFSAGEGDLIFLPPDMVRQVEAKDGFAAVKAIRFSASPFMHMGESIDGDLFYMFLVQARTRNYCITTSSSLYIPVLRYFENCYGEHLSKELCYGLRIRGQLSMMMALVLSSYSTTTKDNDRMVYHNVLRLRPVLEYIDAHFQDKMTVPQLAEYLLVTPDYFTKLFRDSIGKTTVDYINCVRMNRAMVLLLESDMPVADIATEAGLLSGNYFSKLFRKTLGVPPLSYRKAVKK